MQSDLHSSVATRSSERHYSVAILLIVLLGTVGPLKAQTRDAPSTLNEGTTQHTTATATGALGSILNESAILLASDGATNDQFGGRVSISGDVAIVGARSHDETADASGAAYVYRWNGTAWIEEQELFVFDSVADNRFGTSVCISGNVAIVGAVDNNDDVSFSGSAYVFRWDGSIWVEEQELLPLENEVGDSFGHPVSISGDVAIVGAGGVENGGQKSGAVYVFRWNGSVWIQEARLLGSDPQESRRFGGSISIEGDVAVIGAYTSDENGSASGSAYVFRRAGSTWTMERKLLASDGAEGDFFGVSVSISGNFVVVGAFLDDIPFGENPASGRSGSAYVFRWNGAAWIEVQKLLASDGRDGDWFGGSVAVSGGTIVVGALLEGNIVNNSGAAYLFRWNGAAWIQERKLLASDVVGNNHFGKTVSLDGDIAVIGANFNVNREETGSAYVFDVKNPDTSCDVDGADEIANCNGDQGCRDCDFNGMPDRCQLDSDGDGLIDACDACPGDPLTIEPGRCGCGIPETDADGNGIPDCIAFFPIPTVSEWGLAVLAILLLVTAKLRFGWNRQPEK